MHLRVVLVGGRECDCERSTPGTRKHELYDGWTLKCKVCPKSDALQRDSPPMRAHVSDPNPMRMRPVSCRATWGFFDPSIQLSDQSEYVGQDFWWETDSTRTGIAADVEHSYFISEFSDAFVYLSLVGVGAEGFVRTASEQYSG